MNTEVLNCINEFKFNMSDVENIEYFKNGTPEPVKCLAKCLINSFGLIDNNLPVKEKLKTFFKDYRKRYFLEENFDKGFRKCKLFAAVENETCENEFNYLDCLSAYVFI